MAIHRPYAEAELFLHFRQELQRSTVRRRLASSAQAIAYESGAASRFASARVRSWRGRRKCALASVGIGGVTLAASPFLGRHPWTGNQSAIVGIIVLITAWLGVNAIRAGSDMRQAERVAEGIARKSAFLDRIVHCLLGQGSTTSDPRVRRFGPDQLAPSGISTSSSCDTRGPSDHPPPGRLITSAPHRANAPNAPAPTEARVLHAA
jgi:hypothetical protein